MEGCTLALTRVGMGRSSGVGSVSLSPPPSIWRLRIGGERGGPAGNVNVNVNMNVNANVKVKVDVNVKVKVDVKVKPRPRITLTIQAYVETSSYPSQPIHTHTHISTPYCPNKPVTCFCWQRAILDGWCGRRWRWRRLSFFDGLDWFGGLWLWLTRTGSNGGQRRGLECNI